MAVATARTPGSHLVLYDGVCGLCNRLVQFVLQHDRRALFSFAALQSETGRTLAASYGADASDLASFFVVADFRTPAERPLTKSDAALFVARELGWPWKLALVARALPQLLRDRAYDAIARNRYRIFGRYEQCVLPPDQSRSRFVE